MELNTETAGPECGFRSSGLGPRRAFTLVELMVVLVLMSLAVGMTVIGLDGVTQQGRLRSALGRVASIDTLARTQALCDGRPRLLQFETGADRCVLKYPELAPGQWNWSPGLPLLVGRQVSILALVTDEASDPGDEPPTIRIRSDGTSVPYALVLHAGNSSAAVVIDGITGQARYVFDLPESPLDRPVLLQEHTICAEWGMGNAGIVNR